MYESEAIGGGAAISKKSVLVVDDDSSIRNILISVLKHIGDFDVSEVPTAEQGYLLTKERKFDLVIFDHNTESMMTGIQAIKQLRNEGNSTPIMLFSSTLEAIIEAPEHNAHPLWKPAGLKDISQLVLSIIN
ncbi:MAG: response regulator [Patescibacteria group bacterium]|nr:response regulator [Patescibacteria group bacterium]